MKNRDYTILIRIGILALLGYLLIQSPIFDFVRETKGESLISGEGTSKTSEIIPKEEIPEIIITPDLFKDDFILLLKAYKEAWYKQSINEELYEQVKDNEKVMDGLNWLMGKREESLEVPTELSRSLRRYIDENEGEAGKISQIFADKELLSFVREYHNGEWRVNLKYTGTSNSPSGTGSEEKKPPEFKVIGVD